MIPITILSQMLAGLAAPILLKKIAPGLNVVHLPSSRQVLGTAVAGNLLAHPAQTVRNFSSGVNTTAHVLAGRGLRCHQITHTLSELTGTIADQVNTNISNNQKSVKASL